MHTLHPEIALTLARQRRAAEIEAARRRRLARARHRHPIRRTVGRTIVRLGERLAAEPTIGRPEPETSP